MGYRAPVTCPEPAAMLTCKARCSDRAGKEPTPRRDTRLPVLPEDASQCFPHSSGLQATYSLDAH